MFCSESLEQVGRFVGERQRGVGQRLLFSQIALGSVDNALFGQPVEQPVAFMLEQKSVASRMYERRGVR